MNIFYLDTCPIRAAQQQCDKHVVKMILESAQMLSTAHHEFGSDRAVYKSTHKNHPSTVWARECTANYRWLYAHMMALGDEYTRRYGKTHLTIEKCKEALSAPPEGMPWNIDHTPPPQCMPDEYKRYDAVEAYRLYYISKADTIDMRWTNASLEFFNQQEIAA
jgi:hypothetical protein